MQIKECYDASKRKRSILLTLKDRDLLNADVLPRKGLLLLEECKGTVSEKLSALKTIAKKIEQND